MYGLQFLELHKRPIFFLTEVPIFSVLVKMYFCTNKLYVIVQGWMTVPFYIKTSVITSPL